ncbi:DUF4159 domain-containing protein [Acetobacter sp. TBRC 12305]|uniref:DUF4159 domain-containing protein n=1 Tax=Acetobacter garciniae TaxID=2817435 RepID=A0A939HN13_9PROT|nr:DUF4159 domain-containing protein [Acetobacter garciniae]MBO1323941.1 DUF4159 domain-containing protein [Acetobacter garciniae]MBX0343630.1 DUF4159 domain-containing protein [Acetobacter garciniae]
MRFHSPALLLALLGLPIIWWLLRATPPQARRQAFPPVTLLGALRARQAEPVRSPPWLLALRIAAFALLVAGFAGPFLPGQVEQSRDVGPVLLVVDNGMLSATDWNDRLNAAQAVVDDAVRTHSPVTLIATASPTLAENPAPAPQALAPEQARQVLASLRPEPWPSSRGAAAHVIAGLPPAHYARILYLADGIAQPQDSQFAKALQALGPVQDIRFAHQQGLVLAPVVPTEGDVMARVLAMPAPQPRALTALVRASDGATLAVVPVTLPAGATQADIRVALPVEIRNRIDTIALQGSTGAATIVLMDERDRLRPVGLLAAGAVTGAATASADTPLIGTLFYVRRALAPTSDLHEGTLATLLSRPLSVLIAPDGTLGDAQARREIRQWVENGGTLIRFAGPVLAGTPHDIANPPDDLLPVPLLDGTRQLGGSMTWGEPQKLAPFEATSPFRGLSVPADVTVTRQVLASPSADLGEHSWARLADGTPLVTHAALGKGDIVLFHVGSTAGWSNLPLSGLFVSMLQRLTEHANGLSVPADDTVLSPVVTLDGFGIPGTPPSTARGLKANAFATTPVSPEHPPGLYGPRSGRRALNAAAHLGSLQPEAPAGVLTNAAGQRPDMPLDRYSLSIALLLLLLDGLIILLLRTGLPKTWSNPWRQPPAAMVAMPLIIPLAIPLALALGLATAPLAHAQDTPPDVGEGSALPPPADNTPAPAPAAMAAPTVPGAALQTRLAYVVTGHEDVDTASRLGLKGLSDFVNARTSAVLGPPDAVRPGVDDLNYYPLLYWPITADATTSPAMTAALSTFMARGGILLIDTQGQGATDTQADAPVAGDMQTARTALRHATAGLVIPPLTAMTDHHLLAHTFYLLHDFPGRYAGQPVWVAREGDAENDEVSPVIIGSADWAHAWAVDNSGNTLFAVLPGGADQRVQAYRFGLNAVIYALTGSYKADQVHVPMLLKRLEDTP